MPVPGPCSKSPPIPNAWAQRSASYPSCTPGDPTCCPITIYTQSSPAADCQPTISAGSTPLIRCSCCRFPFCAPSSATSSSQAFTDLNMPNLDGIGLIRRLRANPACKGIPIVMLTTESQDARKQEGKAAGATGWIVKPFATQQLLAVVKRVLG